MGANQSTFKGSSAGGHSNSSPGDGGASNSLMELLKPDCLKAEKNKRKRPMSPEKIKKNINTKNNINGGGGGGGSAGTTTRLTTLEEWFLASPGHGMKPDINGSGELYVLRPYSSRRVHPSSSSSSKLLARDSFSPERRIVKNGDQNQKAEANLSLVNNIDSSSISCRSQSGNIHKLKKKVTFRLPQEADIFLFYPSEEIMTTADCSDVEDEDFDAVTSTQDLIC